MERSTELARKMVCEWGMSADLGPISFGKNEEQIFLGREITRQQNYSEQTARRIDDEVKQFSLAADRKAHQLLQAHREALIRLAEALLEYETLDSEEIPAVIRGEKIRTEKSPEELPTPSVEKVEEEEASLPPLVNPNERPATA